MSRIRPFALMLCVLLAVLLSPQGVVRAREPLAPAALASDVTAYDLILAMNTLRVSNGLPALIEDPIVMSVAQGTAEIMAANEMSWHIGDVRGRIAAAGYGAGSTVWATENFAVGFNMGIDQIMLAWADPDHMRPATNPAYCHVGAGVATAPSGAIYYVLQAAYTSEDPCGPYDYSGDTGGSGGSPGTGVIIPVVVATPDEDGKVTHVVQSGQSLWSIAVAYQVTIADLEFWNNISRDVPLWVGQELFIPTAGTEGYATPTPVGMVALAEADADGRIVHVVQPYQTLIGIARAYGVTVEQILSLNAWQADWPLSIGQELLIDPGSVMPSATPRPLSPIEQLTPAADGRYYHTVKAGETLIGIAALYEVPVADLMAWNGLTAGSIIQPDQQLLLQVTPPAPPTSTSAPATATPTASATPVVSRTPSHTPTQLPSAPTALPAETPSSSTGLYVGGLLGVLGVALLLILFFVRRKPPAS